MLRICDRFHVDPERARTLDISVLGLLNVDELMTTLTPDQAMGQ